MSDSLNQRPKASAEVTSSNNQSFDLSSSNKDKQLSDELSTLRSLLFGIEPAELNKIYERLNNPQIQPEDISRLLPEAVVLRSKQDKQLIEAIVSTVEQAIQASVTQDENVLSEAFFPIIGPATRKAISTALEEMMQSLNQTLEHSLSPESFKWRLEARRTGKSFAEIVLLRTLLYRVEQVFLIHKKTGLLLQHVVVNQVTTQDPDLVSAMLTAIQDFARDSFSVGKEDALKSLRFGELIIWVEEGPQALLASSIWGNPPQELRLVFKEAVEKIHLKLGPEINDFTGETEPFKASTPYLEACLVTQSKSASPKNNYTYAVAFLSTIAIALGIWGFFAIREHLRWQAYLQKLSSQPGIVVINTKQRYDKHFILGMRDPLAVDPNTLIQQTNLNPKKVIGQWLPYLSLEPQLTVKRVQKLLQPPKTVSLQIDNNGILHATGSAPRQWILETRKTWRFIPGITQFQDKNLVELEFLQLQSYKQQIEEKRLFFSRGSTDFISGETGKLHVLVLLIQKFFATAKYLGKDVQIQIIGHTDIEGTEQQNMLLSQARAQKILSYLKSQGINTSKFKVLGIGSSIPLQLKSIPEAETASRRVSFEVFIANIPN
ncbi:OmpA family protein [Nostocaceae cyanobacterium CENA369]|uniref:OmpA family protein n=1 Tax=Dendronalium phyllosphericum CENA369 TaxID=1725256 RepID=A0A8J7LC05_9NOST|nr:OmpA family protein [Dendronalium phyllosphericum]MBH8571481.1 OmpA family protein [Dendronalium phyllosphericum CENA369]